MVRRTRFGTARLKWIIQICSSNFFFFSTFEAAPTKLLVVRQFLIQNRETMATQHDLFECKKRSNIERWFKQNARQAEELAYCLIGWLFWVGNRKQTLVGSLPSYHLCSQPGTMFFTSFLSRNWVKNGFKMGRYWVKIGSTRPSLLCFFWNI